MRMRARKRTKKQTSTSYARAKRSARTIGTRTMYIAAFGVLGFAVLIGAATSNGVGDKAATHAPAKTEPAKQEPARSAGVERLAVANVADETLAPVGVPAALPAQSSTRSGPVTTITGCLAREDAAYKLKDTAGDAAPRARTWRTGFLKRGTAPIELYDSSNRVKLPTHVGQRISVTGELIDREMYVRSLQRVSTSCASKS